MCVVTRSRRSLFAALALSLWIVAVPSVPAFAAACDEHGIWVQMSSLITGNGTAEDLNVTNRNLDNSVSCAESHSTAFIENTSQTKMAEMGWVEQWADFSSKTKMWHIFIEGNNGATYLGGFSTGVTKSSSRLGQYDRFKVNNVTGTTQWNFWWDEGSDGGYQQICPSASCPDWDLGFQQGWPEGETSTRGANSGASDNHNSMVYKVCGGGCTWPSWTGTIDPNSGIGGGMDGLDGWKWDPVSNVWYKTIQCTSPC